MLETELLPVTALPKLIRTATTMLMQLTMAETKVKELLAMARTATRLALGTVRLTTALKLALAMVKPTMALRPELEQVKPVTAPQSNLLGRTQSPSRTRLKLRVQSLLTSNLPM
jgi:hypothetical protein